MDHLWSTLGQVFDSLWVSSLISGQFGPWALFLGASFLKQSVVMHMWACAQGSSLTPHTNATQQGS